MTDLRFAILNTGFWARYQLAGWRELPGGHAKTTGEDNLEALRLVHAAGQSVSSGTIVRQAV